MILFLYKEWVKNIKCMYLWPLLLIKLSCLRVEHHRLQIQICRLLNPVTPLPFTLLICKFKPQKNRERMNEFGQNSED